MKKILSIVLSLSLLVAAVVIAETVQKNIVVAKISSQKGSVAIKSADGVNFKLVLPGMALSEKDVIRTGPNSWANVYFENGTIIRIAQNSDVELSKMVLKNGLKAKFTIPGAGQILAAVKKIAKDKNDVQFNTPTAVAGVRGTDLSVNSIDKDTSVVAVFEGKVIVSDFTSEAGLSKDDNTMLLDFVREVAVADNQATEFKRGKGLSKPKAIDASFDADKATIKEMKIESAKLFEESAKGVKPARDAEAKKIREEALKAN